MDMQKNLFLPSPLLQLQNGLQYVQSTLYISFLDFQNFLKNYLDYKVLYFYKDHLLDQHPHSESHS